MRSWPGAMRVRTGRCLAVAVAAVLGTALAPTGALAKVMKVGGDEVSVLPMHGSHSGGGGTQTTASSNLVDHGGAVLSTSRTYAIFWGTQSRWPSDAFTGIPTLFDGFNGSQWLGIGQQYMRSASISAAYMTKLFDSSVPPSHPPKTSAIVSEVAKVLSVNNITPSGTAIYFVYTSNFPSGGGYCAWHSHGSDSGVDIAVAYMPNTTGIAGCDPGNLYNANSYSQGTRSLANVTSHEYMEAITDKDLNAWYDGSGSEIGDKCAWQFSSAVPLTNSAWQLQEEWSNSTGSCVQN
jgi:hypothetical protein